MCEPHQNVTPRLPIFLTVTLEPLSDQSEQHLSTVVAEGRGPVRVHVECVRPNLEIFKRGCRFKGKQG